VPRFPAVLEEVDQRGAALPSSAAGSVNTLTERLASQVPFGGWRLHTGWELGDTDVGSELSMKPVMGAQPALPPQERPMIEHPLTVFVDGPTGFTYIYLFDKGWKFVGRIAQERR
jgi:hypothetical protein